MSANTGKFIDRVKDTASSVSSTTVSLSNAPPTGFQAFSAYSNADVVPGYLITDGTNWEVSYGAYTSSGTTLARASTPIASSNGGAQVTSFSGTVTVFVTDPAAFLNAGFDKCGVYSGNIYRSAFVNGFTTGGASYGYTTFVPVLIKQWFSTVQIYCDITVLSSTTGAVMDMGLYANDIGGGTCGPGSQLCQQSGINCGTGGSTGSNATSALSVGSPKPPGLYWAALLLVATGTPVSPTFEAVNNSLLREFCGATSGTDTVLNTGGLRAGNGTAVALPSPAGTLTLTTTGYPLYLCVGASL